MADISLPCIMATLHVFSTIRCSTRLNLLLLMIVVVMLLLHTGVVIMLHLRICVR